MYSINRAAAIHDLSGFGRASLSVVSPILSTLGVQVCPLPTALLSSHTGFEGYTFLDLTENMRKMIAHWRRLKLDFQTIYSGFLGSEEQADIVIDFMKDFAGEDCLKVVDPVMGDEGRLYHPFGTDMVSAMKKLIANADLITPNITEAALLLEQPYLEELSPELIKKWLVELSAKGPRIVIITGIQEKEKGKTSVAAFDRLDGRFWKTSCTFIPATFPGTGDAFTSVIVGSLLQGDSLPIAVDRVVSFVTTAIRATFGYHRQPREGFVLERVLPALGNPVVSSGYELF